MTAPVRSVAEMLLETAIARDPVVLTENALERATGRAHDRLFSYLFGDAADFAPLLALGRVTRSELDLEFAKLVAEYATRDPAAIAAIMAESPQARPKWKTKRGAGAQTWLEQTIAIAVRRAPDHTAALIPTEIEHAIRSLAQIREHPELLIAPDVVVPGLAWKGRISLMAATEGLGKSTLFAEAANAVSTGRPFLGKLATVQGKVLWVLSEEHLVDVNRRALALDPTKAGEQRLFILEHPTEPLKELEAAVAEIGPRLVILDTLHSFAGTLIEHASQSDNWRPVMETLQRIARAPDGPALLMAAEAVKSTGDYKDSATIGHGVDVVFTLKRFKGEGDDGPSREVVRKKARWPVPKTVYQMQGERLIWIPNGPANIVGITQDDGKLLETLGSEERTAAVLAVQLGWSKDKVERRLKALDCPRRQLGQTFWYRAPRGDTVMTGGGVTV